MPNPKSIFLVTALFLATSVAQAQQPAADPSTPSEIATLWQDDYGPERLVLIKGGAEITILTIQGFSPKIGYLFGLPDKKNWSSLTRQFSEQAQLRAKKIDRKSRNRVLQQTVVLPLLGTVGFIVAGTPGAAAFTTTFGVSALTDFQNGL